MIKTASDPLLFADQFVDGIFLKLGADHADLTGVLGCAGPYICFAGYIVKVDPLGTFGGKHTLGS